MGNRRRQPHRVGGTGRSTPGRAARGNAVAESNRQRAEMARCLAATVLDDALAARLR
jgi:hypothetical protein